MGEHLNIFSGEGGGTQNFRKKLGLKSLKRVFSFFFTKFYCYEAKFPKLVSTGHKKSLSGQGGLLKKAKSARVFV